MQWFGAFIGGMGAGYSVTTLGLVGGIMENVGKPIGKVVAGSLTSMVKQLTLLDCGQLAITAGIKDGLIGAAMALVHKLSYYGAQNGEFAFTHDQLKDAFTDLSANIVKFLMTTKTAVKMIPGGTALDGTFKAFDIGKTFGAVLATYHFAASMAGVL